MTADRPLFTVVCATLLRLSFPMFVQTYRAQSFKLQGGKAELHIRSEPEVNEYVSRNRAAKLAKGEYLYFSDDDCVMPIHTLEIAAKFIEANDHPVAFGGPLVGNMFGAGASKLDEPTWGVGANMCIRKDVFEEIGGFEEDWGLGHPCKGWRADTDIWWRLEDTYPGAPLWNSDLIIQHPGPMGSTWQPEVEGAFFRRWRQKTISRFVPVDPRLQQFLLETQTLSSEEKAEVVKARRAMRKNNPALSAQMPVVPGEGEAAA